MTDDIVKLNEAGGIELVIIGLMALALVALFSLLWREKTLNFQKDLKIAVALQRVGAMIRSLKEAVERS